MLVQDSYGRPIYLAYAEDDFMTPVLTDLFSAPLVSGNRRGDVLAPLAAEGLDPEVQDQYGRPLTYVRPVLPDLYAHAPKGGVTIKGKRFEGGEFIPAEVLVDASPEERAAVESGESRGKPLPPEGGVKEPKQPKSQTLTEEALKEDGWYLEDFQRNWIKNGEAILTQVDVNSIASHDKEPITDVDPNGQTVQAMVEGWKSGYRLPVVELIKTSSGFKIADGRHRLVSQITRGQTKIPALVSTR